MKLIISETARADLKDIAVYIARDNPERALTFVEELVERMTVVGERPMIFQAQPEYGDDIRSAPHRGYRILFSANEECVTILHVTHGSRDLENLIRGKP